MKNLLIILSLFTSLNLAGQNNWEVYGGVGYSNLHQYYFDCQLLYLIPLRGPNFKITFHGGVNYALIANKYINFKVGLGYFQRGSADYGTIGFDEVIAPELDYLRMPFTLEYRLLQGKDFYISGGITPCLLVRNYSKALGFEPFSNPNYTPIDYELGVILPLIKRFKIKANLTKSITNVINESEGFVFQTLPVPHGVESHINISFDISLIFKF